MIGWIALLARSLQWVLVPSARVNKAPVKPWVAHARQRAAGSGRERGGGRVWLNINKRGKERAPRPPRPPLHFNYFKVGSGSCAVAAARWWQRGGGSAVESTREWRLQ